MAEGQAHETNAALDNIQATPIVVNKYCFYY